MNRYIFRLGRLAGLSAIVAALLATVALVDASAAVVKPGSCPTDKPLVVDSYFTAENSGTTAQTATCGRSMRALVSSRSGAWEETRTACKSTMLALSRALPG